MWDAIGRGAVDFVEAHRGDFISTSEHSQHCLRDTASVLAGLEDTPPDM